MVEIARECISEATAKILDQGVHLLLFDTFISLILCGSLYASPGEGAVISEQRPLLEEVLRMLILLLFKWKYHCSYRQVEYTKLEMIVAV
jgi:hypothetical protein